MRLQMLSTQRGSPNGYDVKTFYEGEVYDVSESLARVFVEQKWAKKAPENKDLGSAPENKMAGMILMKAERKFIVDGKEKAWKKGKKYKVPEDVPEDRAMIMIRDGAAEPVEGDKGFMDKMKSMFKG